MEAGLRQEALQLAVDLSLQTLRFQIGETSREGWMEVGGGKVQQCCNTASGLSNTGQVLTPPHHPPFILPSTFWSSALHPSHFPPHFPISPLVCLPVFICCSAVSSLHCFSLIPLSQHPPVRHPSPLPLAEALGRRSSAPANPCISFPIPVPAGLWRCADEGDISSLIVYLIQWHDYWHCVCVCARVRRRVCVCGEILRM